MKQAAPLVLAIILIAASAARAGPGSNVERYCSTEAAFGQSFGARRLEREGRALGHSGNRRAFSPRASFPPFTEFDGGFTPNSRRLHAAQGTVAFESREEARSAFEEMVRALSANPIFQERDIAEPDVSDSGAIWRTAEFYAGNARPDAEAPNGLSVTLYFMERVSSVSTIAMDCVNAEIRRTAEREALAD